MLFPYKVVIWLVISGGLARANEPLRVVALHTVLAEIAREVGGDGVSVTGLLKPGVDPHTYEPSANDIVPLAKADLVLAAGLHLEGYLQKIAVNAGGHARVFAVGDALPEVLALNTGDEPTESFARANLQRLLLSEKGEPDPHWWHSIDNVIFATDLIRAEFARLRPESAELFARAAQVYEQRLFALKAWTARTVASLPPDRRIIITSHDAFGYLAHEWGFTVHAMMGFSTDAEPGARHMVALVDLIRREHVPAVFIENIVNPKTLEVLGRETGAHLAGVLYADGLGPLESPAANYEGMMRHNVRTIVEGLSARLPHSPAGSGK